MSIRDRVEKMISGLDVRVRLREAEEKILELEMENISLRHELINVGIDDRAPERIANLEAALSRMIRVARKNHNEYCDPETQMEIRTAMAILENK